jgi:hypothetical protein
MEALEIEGQAGQEPFARGGGFAPQRELPEAEHLRDDAQDGLDRKLIPTRRQHPVPPVSRNSSR